MALSLNLPYPICYQATRLATRLRRPLPTSDSRTTDMRAYFRWQYDTTRRFHERYWQSIDFDGQVVLDVGSGLGGRAPYFVEHGASQVYCIDINTSELDAGRQFVQDSYPTAAPSITYLHPNDVTASNFGDIALLVDCFEHLQDPAAVLAQTNRWLRPGGRIWIGSIGWYHHAATHCANYIPIPWSQVFFSERAIISTIQRITHDPAYIPSVWDELDGLDRWDKVATLKDRPGEPLNMLSLRQIRRILRHTDLVLEEYKVRGYCGPHHLLGSVLRGLSRLPVAQELFHSYYTAILRKPLHDISR